MNTGCLSIYVDLSVVFCSFNCISLLSPQLIPKYFILFDAIIDGIVFLLPSLEYSLLV